LSSLIFALTHPDVEQIVGGEHRLFLKMSESVVSEEQHLDFVTAGAVQKTATELMGSAKSVGGRL